MNELFDPIILHDVASMLCFLERVISVLLYLKCILTIVLVMLNMEIGI